MRYWHGDSQRDSYRLGAPDRFCDSFGKVSLKQTFGNSDTHLHGVTWHHMCQALND